MKTLTFNQPHNLSKICDELFAAFPEWRTPQNIPGLPPRFKTDVKISGDGVILKLEVPDDTNEVLLAGVVAAHDPTPVITVDPLKTALDATADELTVSADEKSFFQKLYDRVTGNFLPSKAQK